MKTIKMRMTLLIGILLVLLCVGLAAVSFGTAEVSLISKTETSMQELAVQAGQAVDAELSNYLNTLDALSYNEVFHHTGNQEAGEENILKALKTEAARGGYVHMAYVDQAGKALYEDGSYADVKDASYYQKAIQGEKVVTEPMLLGDSSIAMVYAVPVKEGDKADGVILGIRDGFELGKLAGASASGISGTAFIVNQSGNTIAHSNQEIMNHVLDSFTISAGAVEGKEADGVSSATDAVSSATQTVEAEDGAAPDSKKDGQNLLGYSNFDKIQRSMLEGKPGYGEYEFEGVRKIMGYAPVTSCGWSIGLEINRSEALASINELMFNFIVIAILFCLAGLAIVYVAVKKIAKPIEYLTELCHKISTGDFTIEPEEKYRKRRDEIGRLAAAFHSITSMVKLLLRENKEVSRKIANSSMEMDRMLQKLSTTMKEVSIAVEQIAAGNMEQAEHTQFGTRQIGDVEELIEQEGQNMQGLQKSSDKVEQLKEEGFASLKDLVAKTKATSELSREISQVFQETNESAGKIESISRSIGGITQQTKLLALNASIEAARAGESGKGFSVVAKEVEALAEEADKLSKEIAALVLELGEKTLSSVDKVDMISVTVTQQAQSVELTQSKFIGIADAIKETRENIDTLNHSINEMAEKKDKVVKVMMDLSAASEENASGTEEVSQSVQEQTEYLGRIAGHSRLLAEMAAEMDESAGRFIF
ncbi:MAG TPA: HAMP domain-containing protein [Clostridiales bacterium]|nr:HAMP domain-containing protein [Clostridiales bacterium]